MLTCASLSKAYGVPGLRIGWLTVADPRLREQLTLAKFNSSVCCGVLDEFLATRLLSRADQLLASRAALMARPRATVGRWIGEQDSGWSGCGPTRARSAAPGSTRISSGRPTSAASTTGWASGGRRSPPVRGSATAPT